MLSLSLPDRALGILCLGAHPDDIEIGCGGSVLKLLAEHPGSTVWWVVFTSTPERCREARASAAELLSDAAAAHVFVHSLRDAHLPSARQELKELFETLQREVAPAPDLIFTHFRDDRHQDHRVISDLTWETFRNNLVLEYEVPKYDGDLGTPNTFVPLSEAVLQRKVAHLLSAFPSQRNKRAFSEHVFVALLRLRGLESAALEGIAEAFYARKLLLDGSMPAGSAARDPRRS